MLSYLFRIPCPVLSLLPVDYQKQGRRFPTGGPGRKRDPAPSCFPSGSLAMIAGIYLAALCSSIFLAACWDSSGSLYPLPGSSLLLPWLSTGYPLPAGRLTPVSVRLLSGGLSETGRRPSTGSQLSAGSHETGKEEKSSAFLSLPLPEGPALVSVLLVPFPGSSFLLPWLPALPFL